MKFLGQARSFRQHRFELDFRFLARGDLKLQLLGPFPDALFQLVMRLLQGALIDADGGMTKTI